MRTRVGEDCLALGTRRRVAPHSVLSGETRPRRHGYKQRRERFTKGRAFNADDAVRAGPARRPHGKLLNFHRSMTMKCSRPQGLRSWATFIFGSSAFNFGLLIFANSQRSSGSTGAYSTAASGPSTTVDFGFECSPN